jgi:hypothetical protein
MEGWGHAGVLPGEDSSGHHDENQDLPTCSSWAASVSRGLFSFPVEQSGRVRQENTSGKAAVYSKRQESLAGVCFSNQANNAAHI